MMANSNGVLKVLWLILLAGLLAACDDDNPSEPEPIVLHPECTKPVSARVDAHTPQSMVADWGTPVRVGDNVNTPCPEDAIAISAGGQYLYFLFTADLLDSLSVDEMLARKNNTYRAKRNGGPGDFDQPVYYDLAKGTNQSLDGELSFAPGGSKVYFHSNRPDNLGYQANPMTNDFLDIYVADIIDSIPGPGVNLGSPVNSVYPDGEHAIHPDGVTLYITSLRPGGPGGADIWTSTYTGSSWSSPIALGSPINTVDEEKQPTFTPDGDTIYFVSERNSLGPAIYRAARTGTTWGSLELVVQGIVGEPALTADGQLLYFVHVLTDAQGKFDADIWYCERQP